MNEFMENLKQEAENNPVAALAVAAALITAIGKMIKSYGDSAGSRAYARQVNHRLRNAKK